MGLKIKPPMSPLTSSEGVMAVGNTRGGGLSGMHDAIWLGQSVEHLLGVGHCSTTNPRCERVGAWWHQGENPKLTRVGNRGSKCMKSGMEMISEEA